MDQHAILARIREESAAADALQGKSRQLLTSAARMGFTAGLSQRQIGEAIGRSQPEVSRLLRFHGTSRLGRKLRLHRTELIEAVSAAGGRSIRVFGSVARGEDTPESDVDLLIDLPPKTSLFALARLEQELSQILEVEVDVVSSETLRPHFRTKVLEEATPL